MHYHHSSRQHAVATFIAACMAGLAFCTQYLCEFCSDVWEDYRKTKSKGV